MSKRTMLATAAGTVLFGVLLAVGPVHAGQDTVMIMLAEIVQAITGFVGKCVFVMVEALVWVAQYNDFVNASPVATGWTLVRDVANMFFVVALLIIAFGTILGSSSYNYEGKRLTTFIIMAIVVNFSRTLCGLIIDFAQVIMLTFVNGFKEAAGGNFVDALKLGDLLQVNPGVQPKSATDIVVGFLLALFMLGMTLFLMITMTAILVVRIVYLWLLVVLSPIAFLARAVPLGGAQSFYGRWWGMFSRHVQVGPVLAFFLWLSLVSISAGDISTNGFGDGLSGSESPGDQYSQAFNIKNIQQFIIAFGLLAGGMMMAKEMSPEGVSLGNKVTSAAKGAVKWGAGQAYKRSGLKSYRDSRASLKEERQSQREQARGARIAGLMGSVRGGVGGALAKGAGSRYLAPRAVAAQSYREQAAALKQKGDEKSLKKAASLEERAAKLEAKGQEGRLMGGVKRALSAPGRMLAGVAGEERDVTQKMVGAAGKAAMDKADKMSKEDRAAIGLGTRSTGDRNADRAAIIKGMEKGDPGFAGNVDQVKKRAKELGATDDEIRSIEESAKKNFALESGMDAGKLTASIEAGDINWGTATKEQIQQHAGTLAGAEESVRKKAFRQMELSEGGAEKAQAYKEALASSDSPKARTELLRIDPQQALTAKFNVSASGTMPGADDTERAAQRGQLSSEFRGKGAGTAVLKMPPEMLQSKDGKPSDVAQAVGGGITQAELLKAAREAYTKEEQENVAAVLEAMAQSGDPAQEKIARSSAFEHNRRAGGSAEQLAEAHASRKEEEKGAAAERGRHEETIRIKQVNKIEGEIKIRAQSQENIEKELAKIASQIQSGKGNTNKLLKRQAQLNDELSNVKSVTDDLKKQREALERRSRG